LELFLFNSIIQVVRMFRRPAALALVLIAFRLSSLAQSSLPQKDLFNPSRPGLPTGHEMFNSLSGSVVTSDNKPVQDVHVELRNSNGSTVTSVYTNASGAFEFPMVYSGTYDIVASSGMSQTQERIEVGTAPSSLTCGCR
jgi:hypothetical protein